MGFRSGRSKVHARILYENPLHQQTDWRIPGRGIRLFKVIRQSFIHRHLRPEHTIYYKIRYNHFRRLFACAVQEKPASCAITAVSWPVMPLYPYPEAQPGEIVAERPGKWVKCLSYEPSPTRLRKAFWVARPLAKPASGVSVARG